MLSSVENRTNKRRARLESILFKLKNPNNSDNADAVLPESPPFFTKSTNVDTEACFKGDTAVVGYVDIQGNKANEMSIKSYSDGSNDYVISTDCSDAKPLPNSLHLATNRRVSRRPSKRQRMTATLLNDVFPSFEHPKPSNVASYFVDEVQGEAVATNIKKVDDFTSISEPIKIKIEKDVHEDYHCTLPTSSMRSNLFGSASNVIGNEGIFPCVHCKYECSSLQDLGGHMETHIRKDIGISTGLVYPCAVCGKCFKSADFLSRHVDVLCVKALEDVDSKKSIEDLSSMMRNGYKCRACKKTYSTENNLLNHKCHKKVEQPFGCGRCGRMYTHFTNLSNHFNVHKDDCISTLPQCFQCGQAFMLSIELRRHTCFIDGGVDEGKGYSSYSHAKEHENVSGTVSGSLVKEIPSSDGQDMRTVAESETAHFLELTDDKKTGGGDSNWKQCEVCSSWFSDLVKFTMHMSIHKKKKFSCVLCGRAYIFKRSLETHMRVHTGEKPYRCDVCGKDFSRKDAMNKHQKIHLGIKPFVCEACGRRFREKFELYRHSLSHTQEKPHKCTVCSRAYNDKKRLKEHMFDHSGGHPFVCGVCGKGFARKYRFHQHLDQHNCPATFRCNICHLGFVRSSDLREHEQVHDKQKKFTCEVCNMSFLRLSYLRRHRVVHSLAKGHTCSICNKAFSRKSSLMRHITIHKPDTDKVSTDDNIASREDRKKTIPEVSEFECNATETIPEHEQYKGVEERDLMKDIQAVMGLTELYDVFT